MEQEIKDIYDLTENCRDVWQELNPDSDNEPTAEELTEIREVVLAHYAWTAKRLGQGKAVSFNECAAWRLKHRKGKTVTWFPTGERTRIPDFFEVKVNASPTMEELIQQELTPPVPNVK